MEKFYNDEQTLSPEVCLSLKREYDKLLNNVQSLNSNKNNKNLKSNFNDEKSNKKEYAENNKINSLYEDNGYLNLAHICVDNLTQTLHFLSSMQNHSKNKQMQDKLNNIIEKIKDNVSKISALYITTQQSEKNDFDYNLNLKTAIEKLINSLQAILMLLQIENNKKITDSLLTIALSVLEIISDLNGFIIFCNYKILKFF